MPNSQQRYKMYSTKFFCPHCKRAGKPSRLLLEPEDNYLFCEIHKDYKKTCTCNMSDMIFFDMYPTTERENLLMVNEAEDYVETEDEKMERELAKEMFDAFGEDLVMGFDFVS